MRPGGALLALAICALVAPADGKKKRTKEEWKEAMKKIEQEEMEEFEREMEERQAERNAAMANGMENPKDWIESMGGMESLQAGAAASGGAIGGLGGGSQAAMAFIKIKSGYRREQVEEYVIRWRDLLMSNAFDINPYLVEDDLVLMHTEANHRIGELKTFVLDPSFSDGIVDYFEINQVRTYPDGHPEQKIRKKRNKLKVGELLNFTDVAQQLAWGELTSAQAVEQMQVLRDHINATFDTYASEPRPAGQFMTKYEDYASAEYYLKVAKVLADAESSATAAGEKYEGYTKRVKAEQERHKKIHQKKDNPHDVKKVSEMKANILGAFLARGSKGSRRKEQTKEKVDSSHSMDEKDRFANNRKSEKKKLKEERTVVKELKTKATEARRLAEEAEAKFRAAAAEADAAVKKAEALRVEAANAVKKAEAAEAEAATARSDLKENEKEQTFLDEVMANSFGG